MKNQIMRLLMVVGLLGGLNDRLAVAQAQGTAFNYSGSFDDGANPANGSYDLVFTLYNASTSGGCMGTVTNLATVVTNGYFSVLLDFGPVFNGTTTNYWLQLAESTNGAGVFNTLTPLQPILPGPTAVYASTAGMAQTANSVAGTNITGIIPQAQLPAGIILNNQTGVTLSGTFKGVVTGNGAGLTNLSASQIAGTIPGSLIAGTITNTLNFAGAATTNSSTNLVVMGAEPFVLGNNSYFSAPVAFFRPVTNDLGIAVDIMPNGGLSGSKHSTWLDICDTDFYTNYESGLTGAHNGEWLHLQKDAVGPAHISTYAAGNGSYRTLYIQDQSPGLATDFGFDQNICIITGATGNGEIPSGDYIRDNAGNLSIGSLFNGGILTFFYEDSSAGKYRAWLSVTNNTSLAYTTIGLLPSGGTVAMGGNALVASNLTVNGNIALTKGQFSGNGGGLTNLAVSALSGTLANSQLGTNVALLNQVNNFSNPGNNFVGTFAGNGAGLTNMAASIFIGTLADAQLSTNVPLLNQANSFSNPSNNFVGTFTGNGAGMTNVTATTFAGPLADSQLSPNVPLLNQANSFGNPGNSFVGTFTGNGAGLTNVAVTVLSGTLSSSQLGTNVALINQANSFSNPSNNFVGTFTGNGAGLTNVAITSLTGTLASSQLGGNVALLGQANNFSNPSNNFVGTFAGNGAGLTNLSLPASQITGTVPGSMIGGTITNAFTFAGTLITNSSTNLVISGAEPYMLGNNSYFMYPVPMFRPVGPNSGIAVDIMPNGGTNGAKYPTWLDICDTDFYTNYESGLTGAHNGEWLHIGKDASGPAHITLSGQGSGNGNRPLYVQDASGGLTTIFGTNNFSVITPGNGIGEIPNGDYIQDNYGNVNIGPDVNGAVLTLYYRDSVKFRAWLSVTNNTSVAYTTLGLLPSGGTVAMGGNALVASNLTVNGNITLVNGQFAGNGAGLTNVTATTFTGPIASSQLGANVALVNQPNNFSNPGNSFTGIHTGAFTGNGAGLTNVTATTFTGPVADSQLSANVPLQNQANNFVNPGNNFAGTFNGNGGGLTNLAASNLIGTVPLGALGNAITNWGSNIVVTNLGSGKSVVINNGQVLINGMPALTSFPHTTGTPTVTPNVVGENVRLIGSLGDQSMTVVVWFTNTPSTSVGTKIFTINFATPYLNPPTVTYTAGLSSDGLFDGGMRGTLFVWGVGNSNATMYVNSAVSGATPATGKFYTNYLTFTGQ